ncbi:MAG: hypothetical protein KAS21_08080 [Candidatus Aminicenantes bacterium]|nr:hypothetical protein [Candidatus Aminicenantes bacterium]
MRNNNRKNIFIDGHVHLYDNFDPDSFIEAIDRNFRKFAEHDENGFSDSIRMIFLTEAKENDFFTRIADNSLTLKNIDVHSEKTGEEGSILLMQNGSELFYIIRGRQIITKENIEILSVGPGPKIRDGLPAAEVLDQLREREELAILAWGVGKWLFGRGKLVKKIINTLDYPLLLIGDNSARPSIWLKPLIYRESEKLGIPIINGSDPLPLGGEAEKAGSYFFMLKGNFDPKKPLESIKKILRSDNKNIKFLGKRDSIFSFLKRQIKIQLKKHS